MGVCRVKVFLSGCVLAWGVSRNSVARMDGVCVCVSIIIIEFNCCSIGVEERSRILTSASVVLDQTGLHHNRHSFPPYR